MLIKRPVINVQGDTVLRDNLSLVSLRRWNLGAYHGQGNSKTAMLTSDVRCGETRV